MAASLIELRHVFKSFDDTTVLDDFNLTVNQNEFITLLGPSGLRKDETTLRIVGGFEKPDSGQVFFEGKGYYRCSAQQEAYQYGFSNMPFFPHHERGTENIALG